MNRGVYENGERGVLPVDQGAGSADGALTPEKIASTYTQIKPHIRVTPVAEVDGRDVGIAGVSLALKLEQLQQAGSFKTRGAFANLLNRRIPEAGVVAASGGSHGVAVAYAAMRLGVPARIFVPTVASLAKVQRIRDYGAELVITGERYADALAASEAWLNHSGALAIHAFDQIETLLGQGTVALEWAAQSPDLDTVLVPVGGGGLIGGIAAWYRGRVKIIGVEPELAPTLTRALEAGRPVDAETGSVAADSLAPRRVGNLMLPIAQAYVDKVVLVDDAAIVEAQKALWASLRTVAEPGGATALAGLVGRAYSPAPGERIGVLISGGNTTAVNFGA